MEKGNQDESASQAAPESATGTRTADPGTASGTQPAAAPAGDGGSSAAQAAGGQQADQTGPSQTTRREVLYQGYTEVAHHDGSVLRLDGNGGATFTDGSIALRLEGNRWVDARPGQQSHNGHRAKADQRLRQLEVERGLRKSMTS